MDKWSHRGASQRFAARVPATGRERLAAMDRIASAEQPCALHYLACTILRRALMLMCLVPPGNAHARPLGRSAPHREAGAFTCIAILLAFQEMLERLRNALNLVAGTVSV